MDAKKGMSELEDLKKRLGLVAGGNGKDPDDGTDFERSAKPEREERSDIELRLTRIEQKTDKILAAVKMLYDLTDLAAAKKNAEI